MENARGAIGAFESSALMPVWRARLRDVVSIVGCWGNVSANRKMGGGQLFVSEQMRSGHFQERAPDSGANRNPSNAQVYRGKNQSLRGLVIIAFGTEAQID